MPPHDHVLTCFNSMQMTCSIPICAVPVVHDVLLYVAEHFKFSLSVNYGHDTDVVFLSKEVGCIYIRISLHASFAASVIPTSRL